MLRVLPDRTVEPPVERVGMVSVHTSPLAQPGTGDGGGLNVYVLEVARRLADRGVQVDVFTRTTSPNAPPEVRVQSGLRVHHIPAGPARPLARDELLEHLPAFTLGLLSSPRVETPDVLHGHYWLSGWAGKVVAERWGVPLVQTFHTLGLVKNQHLATDDEPEPPVRLATERRVAAITDRVVALTCGEARLLHRGLGLTGARITVVPAGVDTERFRPAPEGPAAGTGDGAPLLLFVGRLQPLKGPDVAIRTLAEVRRTAPSARLLVVGGVSGSGVGRAGPEELRALAADLDVEDAVEILPARPQQHLAELYRAADVVLVPSRTESFGLVALEAQACGTPVVAADVGGLQAVVEGGGTLVPGHDPADHASAALTYLRDPDRAREAGEVGRRTAMSCSWERTVDGLLRVYGQVTPASGLREAR